MGDRVPDPDLNDLPDEEGTWYWVPGTQEWHLIDDDTDMMAWLTTGGKPKAIWPPKVESR